MTRFGLALLILIPGALLVPTTVEAGGSAPVRLPLQRGGGWETYENAAGARDYFVQVPHGRTRGRPLLVFLHGCGGLATDHLTRSGFAELATRERLVVVAPQQIDQGCWDWVNPDHQHRDAGEPSIIAGITHEVATTYGVDRRRIYVGGLSAGAIMTMIMGAAYPDVYTAIFGVAGCPYATCTDSSGQLGYEEMGSRARVIPGVFLQGTLDPLSNYALGRATALSWLGTNDLADDGEMNGSISRTPASRSDHLSTQLPDPGRYPDCDATSGPPDGPHAGCVLGIDQYPYSTERYADRDGSPVVDLITVHGMGHHFLSPVGPDIADLVWSFLGERHSRRGGGR